MMKTVFMEGVNMLEKIKQILEQLKKALGL